MTDAEREGILDATGVRRLYNRIAPLYDATTVMYRGVGAYRLVDRAVESLRLEEGDIVVDLGTGTGYALPGLAEAVGPTGRVIGVDLSSEMLDRARRRCRRHGLDQVDLVQGDITDYPLPEGTSAFMSAYAMEMVPSYDATIARLIDELPTGGRLSVTGLRDPEGWPEWAVRLGSWLNSPFGVAEAYRKHRPWEPVRAHARDVSYDEILGGVVYLAAGTAP